MKKVIGVVVIILLLCVGCSPANQIIEEAIEESGSLIGTEGSAMNKTPTLIEIEFADAQLEAVIRGILGNNSTPIYQHELEVVSVIYGIKEGITDLSGLEYCPNLKTVYLAYNNITDISPLCYMQAPRVHLGLVGNPLADLSPIQKLTGPTEITLVIDKTQVTDLSSVAGCLNLVCLYASENGIEKLPTSTNWTKLDTLVVWGNEIVDISPLSKATELRFVNLEYNNISDISPLEGLTKLETVMLKGNPAEGEWEGG